MDIVFWITLGIRLGGAMQVKFSSLAEPNGKDKVRVYAVTTWILVFVYNLIAMLIVLFGGK